MHGNATPSIGVKLLTVWLYWHLQITFAYQPLYEVSETYCFVCSTGFCIR
jgi:hypothetical protein